MAVETVFLNGDFLPKHEARVSPDDRAFLFGDGVYEVIRAYDGQFFRMEQHLERMQNGLDALRINARAADHAPAYADLLQRNGLGNSDALVYTQITRGAARRVHRFPASDTAPTVFASATEFTGKGDPAGVKVITAPDIRWHRCDIKSLNLVPNCMAAQRAYEAGAFEALLIRDGVALECSATSFFGVFNGEVRTAPATNYILPSITRHAAVEVCAKAGIALRETPIFESELAEADELFLASTTIEIMPVIQVDDMVIGDGTAGPRTIQIRDLVRGLIAATSAVTV